MSKFIRLFLILPLILLAVACSDGNEPKRNLSKKKQPCPKNIDLGYYTDNSDFSFFYDQGKCTFYFLLPIDVKYVDVKFENFDTHIKYFGRVWANNPVWEQELPAGDYIYTCITDNGKIYKGYVTI